MSENEIKNYTESILYAIEQTAIYCRLKGTQVLNKLDVGVTLEQYIALDCISNSKDICQRDLSKLISKDRSNTGRILTILEEKELIERTIEAKNNRLVKKIHITLKGQDLLDNASTKIRENMKFIYEYMDKEEFDKLRYLLNKLKDIMVKNTNIQI